MIGQTVLHYRVLEKLGAGGMGEVYRATDTRLGRDVAIKFLPATFASDPKFRERFEREARAISSLQHPNICVLHDIGHHEGTDFLVLEYLEGETLDARLRRGPLSTEQVLKYGAQIADALDKAHRHGITHRDLKPGNVMLTKTGVKLLDFGLAKPMKTPVATAALDGMTHTPTAPLQAPITAEGTLVGTFQYMSPEQLEGKEADARSDIFALGCVLHEMATGKRAFDGKTTASVVAAILASEPKPIAALHPTSPPALDRAVKTCLAKDPDDRWQSAHDLKGELEWISQATGQVETRPIRSRRWQLGMAEGVLIAVVTALAMGMALWNRQPRSLPRPLARFALTLPPGERPPLITWPALAISPDGMQLVYAAGRGESNQLYLRAMERFEVASLEGTENATGPFFSPDSQWVGFFANGKLKKINLRGGLPLTLCDTPDNRGGSWGPDNTIIFAPDATSGLMRVPASGGTPQALTSPDASKGERTHRWPEILPGGKAVVFTIGSLDSADYYLDAKIAVESLETGKREILPVEGTFARYDPAGYLLVAQRGGLFAVPFDLKRLQVTGTPVRVLDDIGMDASTGAVDYSLSRTGSLVYVPGGWSYADLVLTWVDRKGFVQLLPAPARAYLNPHLSPEGKRVAFSDQAARSAGIWVYDIARGTMMRLTYSSDDNSPVWTPDGKRIAYMEESNRTFAIKWKPADGSGAEETLVAAQNYVQVPHSLSPDGKFLAYSSVGSTGQGFRIWILPLEGDHKPREFVETGSEGAERFSPDGHWIAYASNESGRYEVYVQPFPGPGGKWQISTDGGNWPVWAHSGRELFYLDGSKIMSVTVTTQPGFAASAPRLQADIPIQTSAFYGGNGEFDVSPDGQHFLFVKSREQNAVPSEVRLVLNWSEELRPLATQPSNHD